MVTMGVVGDKRPNPKNRKKIVRRIGGAGVAGGRLSTSPSSSSTAPTSSSSSSSSSLSASFSSVFQAKSKSTKIVFADGEGRDDQAHGERGGKEEQKPKKKRY